MYKVGEMVLSRSFVLGAPNMLVKSPETVRPISRTRDLHLRLFQYPTSGTTQWRSRDHEDPAMGGRDLNRVPYIVLGLGMGFHIGFFLPA